MQLEDVAQVTMIDRMSFSMPWPESAFRYELVNNPSSLLWVAEVEQPEGRRVVGSIVVWMILDEAHIATLAVHPDYRRLGISKQLLAVALIQAIQQGAVQATLEVRANNLAAQALYRRFHFEVVGRRPRYYRDNNEDAIIMTVRLDQPVAPGLSYLEWLKSGKYAEPSVHPASGGSYSGGAS